MKIARIEVVPYALPFKEPYVTARGSLDRREMVLLRLLTDEGPTGLGEAVPLSLRGGASTKAIVDDLAAIEPLLVGSQLDEVSLPALYSKCERRVDHDPSMAAIDSALLDLAAQQAGVPVWSVLGAGGVRDLECNATLVAGTPRDVATEALRWATDGFDCFKLKLGTGRDVETVSAVRSAVGPNARIRIDANGVWDQQEAKHKLAELAQHRIELVEQPVVSLEEMASVRRHTTVPIVADESVFDPEQAGVAVEIEACDATTIKLSKVGGSVDARNIAELLPAYLSSALDGPVGIAAAAHLALAIPDAGLAHGLATQRLFSEWPANASAELDGPWLKPPTGAGLGVELDLAAIERLRIDVE